MFAEFKSSLTSELSSFKNELKRQNDEAINNAVKKIRLEHSARHSFKSKGNEEQYAHEEKLAGHIDDAVNALQSRKIADAHLALEEGKTLIATRMKHIVLADLHGWDFINEYKQIPIAEDDSDEKRIRKVLKTVETQTDKKRVEKSKKANKMKFDSSRRSISSSRLPNEIPFLSMSTCYICGKPGHFWKNYFSRSRGSSGAAVATNVGYAQRQLVQIPQSTIIPNMQTK